MLALFCQQSSQQISTFCQADAEADMHQALAVGLCADCTSPVSLMPNSHRHANAMRHDVLDCLVDVASYLS